MLNLEVLRYVAVKQLLKVVHLLFDLEQILQPNEGRENRRISEQSNIPIDARRSASALAKNGA